LDAAETIWHSRPMLGAEEARACADVVSSGMFIGGEATALFRRRLMGLAGNATAQLFSSGRQALLAALRTLELPPRSGVVMPTYVCDAVAWAVTAAGLRPVLCDVGQHWLVTPETVEAAIDPDCAAILLPPPFGLLQSAKPFRDFGLPIIHDLCQASPQLLAETQSGDLGDILVLSFHPTKYACAGGGGATLSFTAKYGARLAVIEQERMGDSPFTELQAAIGSVQLEKLAAFSTRRTELYMRYAAAIPDPVLDTLHSARDVPEGYLLRMPLIVPHGLASDYFPAFAERGIIVRQGVDNLVHRRLALSDDAFPNAADAFARTLSMPFYPALSDVEASRVAEALTAIL